ncbi:MAG TPA: 4-(cytidine 5'-diphospho)-2-C-methyl-D-erythritol kinase [Nocardioidaceae bacterium]|nr:4-(cytidine 5'-diphospho)-2-C-methyl-D-erythritol kinase [Nocardioidaceae bacterium]
MTAPVPTSACVAVRTPAKINLCLGVGAPRSDGYHPLATVYQAIGVYDDLRARPAAPGRFTIRVDGDDAGLVPEDDSNLAVRAARLLAAQYAVDEGVSLHVRKTIPVAGGMAGGSSDAAAALLACARLWGLDVSRDELVSLAASLGSDVPFCLVGGTATGSGRGEEVSSLPADGAYTWVVATVDGGLSTPAVYAEFDRLSALDAGAPTETTTGTPGVPDALLTALRDGDPQLLGPALSNDLQPAALSLRPDLVTTLEVGDAAGALGSVVSGSGPTTLFLAADERHGEQISSRLLAAGACRSARQAAGPVAGAQVRA